MWQAMRRQKPNLNQPSTGFGSRISESRAGLTNNQKIFDWNRMRGMDYCGSASIFSGRALIIA
jgi:hypothetical protein